jgi:DNA polymerase-3 subunit delta'
MAFKDHPDQKQSIQLLQRSLDRGRLGHAYLFTGHSLEELETMAANLARTLSCLHPVKSQGGIPIDSCDSCRNCTRITHANHPDVHWVRPESKSRVITIDQMRELIQVINLKPTEAGYKVAVIVAADRLNVQAANAFLKTLEEPPAKSILILTTTDPQRLLETILSRCLRLNFAGGAGKTFSPAELQWVSAFSELAAAPQTSLLLRYRLLDILLQKLAETRSRIEESLAARSPLERYEDAEKDLRDKWEEELKAAIEAEYRRQRADLLGLLQRWLRDVWLLTLAPQGGSPISELLSFPGVSGAPDVSRRISRTQATENLRLVEQLQRWLGTNVQEALALEVGLLKLQL